MGRCAAKVSRRAVALAVAGALAPAAVARAVNIPWTNAAGGNFGLATNWNSGAGPVPGVNDTAQFNIANTYTVTLNVDPSVQTVQVGGSNVTFANSVGGRTVTTSGNLNVNSGSFVLSAATPVTWTGNGANFNANATISNGNDLSIGTLGVGNANSSNTTFTGAGTSLSASGISTIANGVGTVGTLSFTGNATGTFDDIRAATLSSGTANINVFTGADVTAGQLEMANLGVAGTNANLTVDGVGSTLAAGPVFVGYTAGSLAAFTVSNSGVVTLNGQLTVDSTGKLDVLSAGKVTANTHVRVFSGSGSRGTLTVSGSGSLFEQTSSGTLTVGSPTGNTATLQVAGGGHYMTGSGTGFLLTWVRPTGVIDVAANGAFTANGNITIDGGRLQRAATGVFNLAVGKTLSVENGGDVHITGDYAHLNGAAINVTGAGSSFTQAGPGMLVVGGGSQLGLASAASLSAVGLNVGDSGGGSVTQSGGTASVGGGAGNRFLIAENAGSTGSYALSGGTLTVTNDNPVGTGETAIGLGGNGTFNQTGGQFVVNGVDGTLVVGYGTGAVPGAVGSYTVENGSLTADAMTVGRGNGAQGIVTVNNGGSIALTKQFMHLGMNVGATGTVNANAGGSIATKGIFVGGVFSAARGTGVLNIDGGNVTASTLVGLVNSGQVRVWDTPGSGINFVSGTLTCDSFNTSGNPGLFNWNGGTLNITGTGGFTVGASGPLSTFVTLGTGMALNVTNATTMSPGSTVACAGGGTFTSGSITGLGNLSAGAGSSITVGSDGTSTTFVGPITGEGSFTKQGVGTLTVNNVRTGSLAVQGGTLSIATNGGAAGTSRVASLTVAPGAVLKLNDNDLLIDYTGASVENDVRQLVKNGRASGFGITSTPGSPDDDKVLAVADNAAWGKSTFNGFTIGGSTVVGKYTYFGDANLDGKVTGDDYLNVDANLGTGDSWLEGDFNMSGVTTGDDYLAIDANLGKGTADPLAFAELKEEMVARHAAMYGDEYLVKLAAAEAEGFGAGVVPEPGGAAALLTAAAVALRRVRRRAGH